jgi:hypothetical protein
VRFNDSLKDGADSERHVRVQQAELHQLQQNHDVLRDALAKRNDAGLGDERAQLVQRVVDAEAGAIEWRQRFEVEHALADDARHSLAIAELARFTSVDELERQMQGMQTAHVMLRLSHELLVTVNEQQRADCTARLAVMQVELDMLDGERTAAVERLGAALAAPRLRRRPKRMSNVAKARRRRESSRLEAMADDDDDDEDDNDDVGGDDTDCVDDELLREIEWASLYHALLLQMLADISDPQVCLVTLTRCNARLQVLARGVAMLAFYQCIITSHMPRTEATKWASETHDCDVSTLARWRRLFETDLHRPQARKAATTARRLSMILTWRSACACGYASAPPRRACRR